MQNISFEIENLLNQYGNDYKLALKEHPRLEYLYALSDLRENLLEWYPFDPQGTVLQIGADYGALTGLYSRKCKSVTVLEETGGQLDIVRMRYPNESNIRYERGTLEEYKTEETYDYVCMIGSLNAPYDAQISRAKSLVKPGGKLIVAVCNRFGVKYWTGIEPEEHAMSRKEITRLMKGNGKLTWYYPMPDYKVPSSIYSESYLPKKGELSQPQIAYDYPRYLLLNVGKKYDEICEDGSFEDFTNSYLIIWQQNVD